MNKKLLMSILRLNLLFCAGIIIVDTYGKVCDMHRKVNVAWDALLKNKDEK